LKNLFLVKQLIHLRRESPTRITRIAAKFIRLAQTTESIGVN
jgi:hypothetical protein